MLFASSKFILITRNININLNIMTTTSIEVVNFNIFNGKTATYKRLIFTQVNYEVSNFS